MESLMSEATNVILSPSRNNSITGSKQHLHECILFSEDKEASSVNLMRSSITSSIKNRYVEVEVTQSSSSRRTKNKEYREPLEQCQKVHVQMLQLSNLLQKDEKSDSVVEDEINVGIEDENKPDITKSAFTRLLSETDAAENKEKDENSQRKPEKDTTQTVFTRLLNKTNVANKERNDDEIPQREPEENAPTQSPDKLVSCKRVTEIGLKLARQKFPDGIFENCSTYNLACPEIILAKDVPLSPKKDSTTDSNHSVEDKSLEITGTSSSSKSNCSTDIYSDDQISLGDSFFANVINDEYGSSKRTIRANSSKKSSKDFLTKENYSSTPVDVTYDKNTGKHLQSKERKLSKRHRKRQRKSMSKDASVYECSKCGTSYKLSSNAIESTARCLHCDFWTSVEPEFLKREKLTWNTCRVC